LIRKRLVRLFLTYCLHSYLLAKDGNVKKDIINEIFETLSGAGVVSTEGEFSQDWLGHCESYLRTLRFKNAEPSMGALAICSVRLQKVGRDMVASKRHQHVGLRFLALSEKCYEQINKGAVELELAN
jgi:hypothetical protein